MNWQSSKGNPPTFKRATSQAKATFDASLTRENMLSPQNAPPMATP
tara:strand:+ start:10278 stop:10415 length:138 start_codon:yes stop_codon:yes gene_type:complete